MKQGGQNNGLRESKENKGKQVWVHVCFSLSLSLRNRQTNKQANRSMSPCMFLPEIRNCQSDRKTFLNNCEKKIMQTILEKIPIKKSEHKFWKNSEQKYGAKKIQKQNSGENSKQILGEFLRFLWIFGWDFYGFPVTYIPYFGSVLESVFCFMVVYCRACLRIKLFTGAAGGGGGKQAKQTSKKGHNTQTHWSWKFIKLLEKH